MPQRRLYPIIVTILTACALSLAFIRPVSADLKSQTTQQPTLMATVTGTPITGVVVTASNANDTVNVRSGPNSTYQQIGVLIKGQQVIAKGMTPKGEWLLIEYPGVEGGQGWVYQYNMVVPQGSFLPIVEPPAEPTTEFVPTIDPTLASQFIVTPDPTRLPTFTPAPALVIPTLPSGTAAGRMGIPAGMIILALGALGAFLGLVSLFRGK
ncbi:MAG TPA: SH3 domain-containing protein [Anaerolineaceae bacterium]|nr:SH3 domain-containing protein [Anaerolineaceae bacterium]